MLTIYLVSLLLIWLNIAILDHIGWDDTEMTYSSQLLRNTMCIVAFIPLLNTLALLLSLYSYIKSF